MFRVEILRYEFIAMLSVAPNVTTGSYNKKINRYNKDPSWYEEIKEFARCILENKPVTSSTTDDALQTMKLVYKIYHADPLWRQKYSIQDPDKL